MAKKTQKTEPAAPTEDLSHIASGLRALAVSIDSIKPDPHNARRHGERNLESIRYSLKTFGQQKPIVVDADGIVRAGNGTLEGAKSLGWTTIAAVKTELRGAAATAYGLADNRTSDLSEWDAEELAAQLDELGSADIGLGDLGFTTDEIDALLEGEDVAPAESPKTPRTKKNGGASNGDSEMPAAQFKIVIECENEGQQADLLDRFEREKLKCRALMA